MIARPVGAHRADRAKAAEVGEHAGVLRERIDVAAQKSDRRLCAVAARVHVGVDRAAGARRGEKDSVVRVDAAGDERGERGEDQGPREPREQGDGGRAWRGVGHGHRLSWRRFGLPVT